MTQPLFKIEDLKVSIEGKQILDGVNLTINAGEIHALMGRNGTGKSTLANTLMGHPKYEITGGKIWLAGQDITELEPEERSIAGLFLAFQYPIAIPGVNVVNFLRAALKAHRGGDMPIKDFRILLKEQMNLLSMQQSFASRYVNDGFSGGEKKRLEILQMAMLNPKMVLLDETDSGLDIDALKVVAEGINRTMTKDRGVLLVTHYQRILDFVKPNFVHVMMNGKIVKSGGPELALELEKQGYDWLGKETKHENQATAN
ncbi:MAG: Fe-S cluster assembly ATPase SufC [Deltaproteobacteria bacterium CG11_big_fil_rev_8_21_14_0_20_47_16]|nr:MAG: Fe-S cluster assembly ATPase SufC [Deltaproteobacteria bacterium CG11_big_fil_rev_8_21_14_0_20_47_16]